MNQPIRVALVGAGRWGFQHARALSMREDVQLVSVFSRTAEKAAARGAQFHIPWYTDLQQMLVQESPDFVSVFLPAQHSFETTMQVVEAGIPLMMERPLAYCLSGGETLINRAQQKQLFFAIDFEQRYSIPCVKAKEAIDAGKLGKLVFAHWRFGHGWGSPVIDHPFTNLIEAQCHGINMLEYLCGPMESVMTEMTDNGGKQSFSSFVMSIRFINGAVGSFLATLDANENNRLCQLIELGGTDARILIEDNVQRYTFQRTESDTAETWSAGFFDDDGRAFRKNVDRYWTDMLKAFRAGEQPPVPATEGLRALQIAKAAITSYQTGKRVIIPQISTLGFFVICAKTFFLLFVGM